MEKEITCEELQNSMLKSCDYLTAVWWPRGPKVN